MVLRMEIGIDGLALAKFYLTCAVEFPILESDMVLGMEIGIDGEVLIDLCG